MATKKTPKDKPTVVVKPGSSLENVIEQRSKFTKSKLPVAKRVQAPKSIEREYLSALKKMIAKSQKLFRQYVVPVLKGERIQVDAPTELNDALIQALKRFAQETRGQAFPPELIEEMLRSMAEKIDINNGMQVAKTYDRLTPLDLQAVLPGGGPIVESFVAQNASLITKVSNELIANVERIVLDKATAGARWEDIVTSVERGLLKEGEAGKGPFSSFRKRAALIARDQTHKMNAQLTRERQERLGVELYRWRAVMDSRTRATHAQLNGKIFSWKGTVRVNGKTYEPAKINGRETIPGMDINCRCVAEAVLEV